MLHPPFPTTTTPLARAHHPLDARARASSQDRGVATKRGRGCGMRVGNGKDITLACAHVLTLRRRERAAACASGLRVNLHLSLEARSPARPRCKHRGAGETCTVVSAGRNPNNNTRGHRMAVCPLTQILSRAEPIRCESAEFGHKLYSSVHAASVVVDGPTAKNCAATVCWNTPLICRHRRRRTSVKY